MKRVSNLRSAAVYLFIVLLTFFFVQTCLILMHEFTHSMMAWFYGDISSPMAIVWGNPLMMTGWDEGVHYSKLFPVPGHAAEALIGGSPLLLHAVLVALGIVLLQKSCMMNRKWAFHLLYWFVVANMMELVAYIAMRPFASGGDTGHFNRGLGLSPWFLFVGGTLLLVLGLYLLFRKVMPRMYILFAAENRLLRWLILFCTAFFLFLWGSGIRIVCYIYPDPQWMFGLSGFVAFFLVLYGCRPEHGSAD
ncbi:MAG: hypothetical protein PHP44_06500 [Kiritimatiellae bacterium]|nr:hypothetical protein [Kiritimatiellia bacterium]MDD4735738.1 hypothetical protein [Kiritimatiellia bacterium]